jgi:hypothetical protein
MIHRSMAKMRGTNACVFSFALLCTSLLATPAVAESFCDLVPAATVKTTLGITEKLVTKPKSEGSIGCHYKTNSAGPIVLIADASDASGMMGTMFEQRLASLGPKAQVIQGLGDAAYYSQIDNEQISKFPGVTYTQQSIVFRAKGKIISLILTTAGNGVPKEALQSLANLAASKPIENLLDPSS